MKGVCFVSLILTALVMLLCSVSGTVGMIAPWLVFLYQIFWILPAILFCGQVR